MTSTPPETSPRCACCGATVEGAPAFVHPSVPLFLNVLAATEQEARTARSGRLELFECPGCGFVFNRAFEGLPYGPDYFVDATLSPRYREHLDDVSDRLAARVGRPSPFSVVDVGAGQGTFLAHLIGRLGERISVAHGFDPAFRSTQAKLPSNVGFTASNLDRDGAGGLDFRTDAVVTRHVLEHVPDPIRFLSSIRESVGGPFELLVETPNVAHTLDRGLLHDFCYEHCAMSTGVALAAALRSSGFDRVRVETGFGGEYLLGFASAPAGSRSDASPEPVSRVAPRVTGNRLADLANRFVSEHRERLERARARGPIAIWGGAGKGALFAHLVDPDRALVDFVVDIHPKKHGTFLPGAGHRIVSPEDARRADVRTIVVANATYADEIASLCEAKGLQVEIECVGDDRCAGARGDR